MAIQGKVIHNTKTKQSIRFIRTGKDTGGQLLEMETLYLAHSKEPPMHYHPVQTEDFEVLQGELTVKLKNQIWVLKAGDTLHIPVRTPHAMWNHSRDITIVNWQVRPAMHTEYLLETVTGLANDDRTNADGVPGILQIALTGNRFADVFRLIKPAFAMQRIVFILLTPLAWVLGYRATYKKYID